MRSISRVADAGAACEAFHDETVRNVKSRRIQWDEIWSFVCSKQKNVAGAKAAPDGAGDCWTWTAIDADTKLMVTWSVGDRDAIRKRLHAGRGLASRYPVSNSRPMATPHIWKRLRARSVLTLIAAC